MLTDFSSCLMAILDQNLYVAGLFANDEEVNLIDEAIAAMRKRMVLCLFSISWIDYTHEWHQSRYNNSGW